MLGWGKGPSGVVKDRSLVGSNRTCYTRVSIEIPKKILKDFGAGRVWGYLGYIAWDPYNGSSPPGYLVGFEPVRQLHRRPESMLFASTSASTSFRGFEKVNNHWSYRLNHRFHPRSTRSS